MRLCPTMLTSCGSLLLLLCLCHSFSVETRESLEEAHTSAELQTFARHNLSELKRVQESIAHAFAAGDLTAMRQHTIRLSFLTTIEEEIYRRMPVQ